MTGRKGQPLDEIVGPGTALKALTSVVGALALLALANLAILGLRHRHPGDRAFWLVREKWLILQQLRHDVTFLVLGDSSGNQSVRPDVLGQAFGGGGLNLCTVGDMMVLDDAWMLQYYLARHAAPQRVVLVHTYDAWPRDQKGPDHWALWNIPLEPHFWKALKPTVELTPGAELDYLTWRYLPLYADHATVSAWLLTPQRLRSSYRLSADGFMPWEIAKPGAVEVDTRRHFVTVRRPESNLISPINRQSLDVIRALADEHHFDVYLASSPTFAGAWADAAYRARYAEVQAALREAVGGDPRMHVLFDTPALFPKTAMENTDHVVGKAAGEFSRRVIEAIKAEEDHRAPPDPGLDEPPPP